MALEKELINGKGVKTTYHRIDSISMVDGIEVTVKSYTDESYRQQEKERESVIERQKEVKEQLEADIDKETAVSYESMYENLKQEPMFEGAADVLEE